jgi:hypothetical protein
MRLIRTMIVSQRRSPTQSRSFGSGSTLAHTFGAHGREQLLFLRFDFLPSLDCYHRDTAPWHRITFRLRALAGFRLRSAK